MLVASPGGDPDTKEVSCRCLFCKDDNRLNKLSASLACTTGTYKGGCAPYLSAFICVPHTVSWEQPLLLLRYVLAYMVTCSTTVYACSLSALQVAVTNNVLG